MTSSTMAKVQRTITPVDGSVYVERALASDRDIENSLAKALAAQHRNAILGRASTPEELEFLKGPGSSF
jgi:hypothetical protein